MFGLCEYLLSQAQRLDFQGCFASADIIDRLAQSTLDEKYPVLYHGTKQDYDAGDVDVDQNMQGLYMTTSHEGAAGYGDVRSYQLKPGVKILDLSDGEELWQWMQEQGILDEEDIESIDLYNYVTGGQVYQYDLSSNTDFADDIVKTARYLGYDVIKMPDYPLGEDHTAWVATHKDAIQPAQRTASSQANGEYWIGEDGRSIYADGDVGDYNHAMIAEQEILSRLGYDVGDYEFPASLDDAEYLFSRALDNAKKWGPEDGSDIGEYFEMLLEEHGEDEWKEYAELDEFLLWNRTKHIKDEEELARQKQDFNQTWAGTKDPTLHAIQHFGWHRVKPSGNIPGISVETWELTPEIAETIANGLYDSYDDMASSLRYNIDVRSTGDYLTNVPFSEIENGTVVYRMKNRQPATPMQKSLDNVDLSNQMATHAPVSDAGYRKSLETNYPGNDKIKELYRYEGASNSGRLVYSWMNKKIAQNENQEERKEVDNPYLDEYMAAVGKVLPTWGHMFGGKDFSAMERAWLAREKCTKQYGYAIPNQEAIDTIVQQGPVVEIGSGLGYWAKMVQDAGGDIAPYDMHAHENGSVKLYSQESYVEPHTKVAKGDHSAAELHSDRALFMCWPPYDTSMGYDCLKTYLDNGGHTLIYVGEGAGGCTGDDAFHQLIDERMELVKEVNIPVWPGIHDYMSVYKLKSDS